MEELFAEAIGLLPTPAVPPHTILLHVMAHSESPAHAGPPDPPAPPPFPPSCCSLVFSLL